MKVFIPLRKFKTAGSAFAMMKKCLELYPSLKKEDIKIEQNPYGWFTIINTNLVNEWGRIKLPSIFNQ